MQSSSYKDLKVWQKSMDMVIAVYNATALLPNEEKFGLANQMNRAAVSIPSNIAEGHGRNSNKEFIKFLYISRGSLLELETQTEICFRLNLIDSETRDCLNDYFTQISKMINSLIDYRKILPEY